MTNKDDKAKASTGRGVLDFRLFLLIAKGLLYEQSIRRSILFFLVLAALGIAFAGGVLIDGWLAEHLFVFLLYWLICGWLTLTSFLLALFDLLMLRRTAREERKRLHADAFRAAKKPFAGEE